MDDRIRTLSAYVIIIAFVLAVIAVVWVVVTRQGIVSPVPEESPIRIIILSPAPSPAATPRMQETPASGEGS